MVHVQVKMFYLHQSLWSGDCSRSCYETEKKNFNCLQSIDFLHLKMIGRRGLSSSHGHVQLNITAAHIRADLGVSAAVAAPDQRTRSKVERWWYLLDTWYLPQIFQAEHWPPVEWTVADDDQKYPNKIHQVELKYKTFWWLIFTQNLLEIAQCK